MSLLETKKAKDFFEYRQGDYCEVLIQDIYYNILRMSRSEQEVMDSKPANWSWAKKYQVYPGYWQYLVGSLRKIQFMVDDKIKSHNYLFWAVYLIKILDIFAEELDTMPKDTPFRFCSHILNPLLQHQLCGISDHESEMIFRQVGNTMEDTTNFYLMLDPLDPKHKTPGFTT